MRGDFDLTGYRIEGLLGAGATGEVWLALEESSQVQVALKRLRLDPAVGIDAVRRLTATLDALDHQHLVRVRRIEGAPTEPVLVCDYAESGSLAELLRARDRLDPGEVVTVIGPVAEALAAVHGRGLVHGAVTPENVLFTQDGRPLLADTGLWSVTEADSTAGTHGLTDPQVIAGAEPTAASDVFGLAATAWTALTGTPVTDRRPPLLSVNPGIPPGLAHAVESGLQAEPDLRPAAEQFADMIYAAAAPVAVRFPIGLVLHDPAASDPPLALAGTGGGDRSSRLDAEPTPEGRSADPSAGGTDQRIDTGSRRHQAGRLLGGRVATKSLLVAGAVLVLAVGVVSGGVALGRVAGRTPTVDAPPSTGEAATVGATAAASPGTTTDPAAVTAAPADWTVVLHGLMAARSAAFGSADGTALGGVFVDDSPAMRYDQTEMAKLTAAGAHAENLDIAVTKVAQRSATGDSVTLTATTRADAYDIVQADGTRSHHAAQAPKSAPIVLQKAADGTWRIYRW